MEITEATTKEIRGAMQALTTVSILAKMLAIIASGRLRFCFSKSSEIKVSKCPQPNAFQRIDNNVIVSMSKQL